MIKFLSTLLKRLSKHDVVSYAAQGAYYLLLGFFPFLILILMFITAIGIEYIQDINNLLKMLPEGTSELVKGYLSYSKEMSSSLFSPLLITTILMSSSSITALRKAFNIAEEEVDKRSWIKTKSMAIVFVILIVIMFTILLFVSALGLTIVNKISSLLQVKIISDAVFKLLSFALNFSILLFVVGLMYYFLPYRRAKIKEILPGALFAAPTLTLLSQLFGYIVANFTKYSIVYGSLTSIVMLLIWLFFAVLILIIGEEINAVCRLRKKSAQIEKKELLQ